MKRYILLFSIAAALMQLATTIFTGSLLRPGILTDSFSVYLMQALLHFLYMSGFIIIGQSTNNSWLTFSSISVAFAPISYLLLSITFLTFSTGAMYYLISLSLLSIPFGIGMWRLNYPKPHAQIISSLAILGAMLTIFAIPSLDLVEFMSTDNILNLIRSIAIIIAVYIFYKHLSRNSGETLHSAK